VPNRKTEDEERNEVLAEIVSDHEFKKRLWATIRRWGTWLIAFVMGVTVIRDFITWVYKLMSGK
jgi:membrane protein YqaA with SNARE-associated domain